jgi:heme-degrading monooxygenase HmoA
MHMLHIDGKVKFGRRDEFLNLWHSKIIPEVKQQSGFIDEMLLFEETGNGAIGLSFWKTREDAERFLREGFEKAKSHVAHLIHEEPKLRSFEVKSSETFNITGRKAA